MTDQTAGWTWTRSVQYQSGMGSAEWIVEAPYGGSGELPLADFAQATVRSQVCTEPGEQAAVHCSEAVMMSPGLTA